MSDDLISLYRTLSKAHKSEIDEYENRLSDLKNIKYHERREFLNNIYIDKFNFTYKELTEMNIINSVIIDNIVVDMKFIKTENKIYSIT